MNCKKLNSILFLILFIYSNLFSQTLIEKKYITIIPDSTYEAGWFWEFWFGEHWRDVWATPVTVEILDLKNFDGGLKPIKKGGGLQTKSLKFISGNGITWKFRSLDKDPSKLLPPEFQESIAEELLKDQISSSNPFAPLVVSPLLKSVDVLESEPKFIFLPDDSLLSVFRDEFKNQFGTIEIHPDDYDDDEAFADADDVKSTYKLFEHLEKKRDEKISSAEFLKARLIDILLGDWDRHMDQWRWAKFKIDDEKIWYPIPRDRDQAFVKYDGIFPRMATYILPQLTSFDKDYPSVKSLTWNGKFLDRHVLTEMDKFTWDSITVFVKSQLNDAIILNAVNQLPAENYSLISSELIYKLLYRRDHLEEISNEFYELINEVADIFCGSKDDIVFITRENDKHTIVDVFNRYGSLFDKKGEILFHKKFDNDVTDEIRIYLNDGDDAAIIKGECNISPLIRIIGGKGKDDLIDSSVVNGYFLGITPFKSVKSKTLFYDSGNETTVKLSEGSSYDDYKYPFPKTLLEKYEPPVVDRGSKFVVYPLFSYNTDYGFISTANAILFNYDFRKIPYAQKHQFELSFASRFSKFSFEYNSDIKSFPTRKSNLKIKAIATQQHSINYFGYGNETRYISDLDNYEFYRVDQQLIILKPEITLSVSQIINLLFGLSYNYSNTSLNTDSLLNESRYNEFGSGNLNRFGIHPALELELRDNAYYPVSGLYSKAEAVIYHGIFNDNNFYSKFNFDLRLYFLLQQKSQLTLVTRIGGSKVFGKFPYFDGATLGGTQNLRAYNKNRFSGDASVFGQIEMRMYLTHFKFIFNNKIGVNVFAETGRVYANNDESDKWHPSFGGGIWVSYLDNEIILSSYIALSGERTIFNLGFGFNL